MNNDVGFHFCQGLLYEHSHGLGTVDWAELAVTTINWYRTTKGMKKVHDDWAHAYPSITIDVFTKQPVCALHPHGKGPSKQLVCAQHPQVKNPSKPMSSRLTVEKLLTPSSADEVKKRRPNSHDLQSNSSRDIKRKINNGNRVKVEYVKKHVSPAIKETHTDDIPNVEISTHAIPSVKIPPENIPNVEMSTSKIPSDNIPNVEMSTSNIPIVESTVPKTTTLRSMNKIAPKPLGGSPETTHACTPSFLNALQFFRIDFERAMDAKIKNLEEEKMKLQSVLDDTCYDVDIATAIVKNLMDELEIAKLALSTSDTDYNRREVRCIHSAIKSGEAKLKSKRAKYNVVFLEWCLQAQTVVEKCQAQKSQETHF